MTLRELVDIKETFETLNGLNLIINEINTNYNEFEVYYCITYKFMRNIGIEFDVSARTSTLKWLYNNCKIVNKNPIKHIKQKHDYSLRSVRKDAILNIIGDVDINKDKGYVVFWDNATKDLICVVNYQLMSPDKQKIIDGLVNKYYTRMLETYNKEIEKLSGLSRESIQAIVLEWVRRGLMMARD